MIALIDNFDSFTYNLVQRLGEIDGALDIRVYRNNEITVDQLIEMKPDRVIISPGPCTPTEAGISVECCQRLVGKMPVLGVCLGHQSMGQAFGGKIVRAKNLMHGKTDMIHHDSSALFAGLDDPFQATRYHSLVIQPDTLPKQFRMTAWSEEPGGHREIMGIEHRDQPMYGVQFHPESFLTHAGYDILRHFLAVS
jgi:anthranilate synthase/aminodeoxychorismate synthase-like glutamine amidotransferase